MGLSSEEQKVKGDEVRQLDAWKITEIFAATCSRLIQLILSLKLILCFISDQINQFIEQ